MKYETYNPNTDIRVKFSVDLSTDLNLRTITLLAFDPKQEDVEARVYCSFCGESIDGLVCAWPNSFNMTYDFRGFVDMNCLNAVERGEFTPVNS